MRTDSTPTGSRNWPHDVLRADQVTVTSPRTWIDLPAGTTLDLVDAGGFTLDELGPLGPFTVSPDRRAEGYVEAVSNHNGTTRLTLNGGPGEYTVAVAAEQPVRLGANMTSDAEDLWPGIPGPD